MSATGNIPEQEAGYELRDHLNADHGYTIPVEKALAPVHAGILRREHAQLHGLCMRCGGEAAAPLCPSCAAGAAHARIDLDLGRALHQLGMGGA